tara:strand:- start:682 stop:870 length:189 start_codon:yes stop_codon:yes gene_type:complete
MASADAARNPTVDPSMLAIAPAPRTRVTAASSALLRQSGQRDASRDPSTTPVTKLQISAKGM